MVVQSVCYLQKTTTIYSINPLYETVHLINNFTKDIKIKPNDHISDNSRADNSTKWHWEVTVLCKTMVPHPSYALVKRYSLSNKFLTFQGKITQELGSTVTQPFAKAYPSQPFYISVKYNQPVLKR